jgi:rhamnulokinase
MLSSLNWLAELAQEGQQHGMFIDPDDPRFLAPGDMPTRIRDYCHTTGQSIPDSIGSLTRCIFESLALKYRYVLSQLMWLTGRHIETIHIVGGGAQNALLCQMTADATGCRVLAGPAEATALGNMVVQLIALGELRSVEEGRALIRESFPLTAYEPHETECWLAVESRFNALVEGQLA